MFYQGSAHSMVAVPKLQRTCGQILLPVSMFNYYICLHNNVCERNGNTICLNSRVTKGRTVHAKWTAN